METAAYWIALVTVVVAPPAILFWLIVHPLARQLRKMGPGVAYPAGLAIPIALGAAVVRFREPLLRVHFGVSWPLVTLAIALFAVAFWLGMARSRYLPATSLLGWPELSAGAHPGRLITEGPYAHIRHPRYVETGLGLAAIALFCNYLATYALVAAYVPLIYWGVLLEERELRERFGEQYEQYCRQVPRFVPRRLIGRKTGRPVRPREG